LIELSHITKKFPDCTPIKNLSVKINNGDVVSIIGPSGAGKSMLLRCINLLSVPTSGQIFIDGEEITAKDYDITKVRRKIGMVFQNFNLFPHLTVIENIMNPQIRILRKSKKEAYETGISLLADVGLSEKYANYPDELSGGQKQRVAICRALAMDPEVILFDEPTSALDPTMVSEVQTVIQKLAKDGRTMMIVTHDMKFARSISNRVFYVDDGEIYEEGTPKEIFENPQKEKTKIFIEQINTLNISFDFEHNYFQNVLEQIEKYGNNNFLPYRLLHKIISVFDELCGQILQPQLEKTGKIKIVISYNQKQNEALMKIYYNGESFNPSDSVNTVSLDILKFNSQSMLYNLCSDGIYTNLVKITLGTSK